MYLYGKALYDKSVCVYPRHRKFCIMFLFENDNDSKEFYDSFNHKEKSMLMRRASIMMCRHKNKYELDVGRKTHHYTYCPDCKMALYVNDETEEDKIRNRKKFELKMEREDIERAKSEIKSMKNRLARKEKYLARMEKEYREKYAKPYGKVTNIDSYRQDGEIEYSD